MVQDDKQGRRDDRIDRRRERREAWRSRWTYRLDKVKEKTQLMWAKAARWKWLAIVLAIIATAGAALWAKLGGIF